MFDTSFKHDLGNAKRIGRVETSGNPIMVEYDGWQFALGRYNINIDPKGDIKIEALDPPTDTDYPHPHVNTDGYPCLGNIAADIPKMLGSMRVAEALQVLYEFLCEYNPDSPYEKISYSDNLKGPNAALALFSPPANRKTVSV